MNSRQWVIYFLTFALLALSHHSFSGGWDAQKGLDKMTMTVELVCLGCSLKRLSGANAQCDLYSQHDVGVKLADGSLWSLVNNAKGHDVIKAHTLVIGKKANLTGWLYPNAHHIEIDTIDIQGISAQQLASAAWVEDQKSAKTLLSRKQGNKPILEHVPHSH